VVGHEHGHFMSVQLVEGQQPGRHALHRRQPPGPPALLVRRIRHLVRGRRPGARSACCPRPDLYIDTDGSPAPGNLGFSYSFETPSSRAYGAARRGRGDRLPVGNDGRCRDARRLARRRTTTRLAHPWPTRGSDPQLPAAGRRAATSRSRTSGTAGSARR
jgi:hypothetical protein